MKIHTLLAAICCLSLISSLLAAPATTQSTDPRNLNAIGHVHSSAVPQVDRHGQTMTKFDPSRSMLVIGAWGEPVFDPATPGTGIDWKELAAAGFNTVWTDWSANPKNFQQAKDANLQVVLTGHVPMENLKQIQNDPNLMCNVWMDEPSGNPNEPALWKEYQTYKQQAHEAAPSVPVLINDSPCIMPPLIDQWNQWNVGSDICCDDVYPLIDRVARARSIAPEPNGIPQVVAHAIAMNHDAKPIWIIIGAFNVPAQQDWPFRWATPMQLRAQVYSAIIAGATGIQYFVLDSAFSRRGQVIGISPNPQATYPNSAFPATPTDLVISRSLWEMTKQINSELKQLTPAILSPTCVDQFPYSVKISGKSPTQAPIRTLIKPAADGGYILMTVNCDDAVLDVTYTFDQKLKSAATMFENQPPEQLDKSSIRFTRHYEPFETHVFRITPQSVKAGG